MNFFTRLIRRLQSLFLHSADISKVFNVEIIASDEMNSAIKLWNDVSRGRPPWANGSDDIHTINMAKHIADTRAKLIALDIGIAVSGSPRADYIQTAADELLRYLPDRLTDACRLGGMMIKWNGKSWDFVLPGSFGITAKDNNGKITGAIFASHATQGRSHYTRLEYHRFENDVYVVTNKAFRNQVNSADGCYMLGTPVPLTDIGEWADMQDEVRIANLQKPLFGYFRIPGSNTIDVTSPLGMSIFANALTELHAVDVAISRKDAEVEDSKHITFVGQTVVKSATNNGIELPRFVRALGMGINDSETTAIHEHVPTLQTDARIKDINFNLSLAGVKCGFSEGVFVMNGQTGMITATQVESDDRDTIQTIKTDRDALKEALEQALYSVDVLATLLDLAPIGTYEVNFNFGDITYSYEEDKTAWRSYAMQGWVPKWMYLVKFEGMSEEEAKALTTEAQTENMAKSLFDTE